MDQGLLGDAGQWDKGQQAGTEAQEVPPEHQEEVPYCAGDTALEQVTQVGCGFPPPWRYSRTIWTHSCATCSRTKLPEQGGWIRCPTVVLSSMTHPVILYKRHIIR